MSRFRYITQERFESLLERLNVDFSEEGGFTFEDQDDLLDRANADLESDLVKRFVVPLQKSPTGPFSAAPEYARNKVLNALIAKIRQLVGDDTMKNIAIDSSERYIDLKKGSYRDHIKELTDAERDFGFRLQPYAESGALQPVQQVGVARPDDRRSASIEDEDIIF